jgi:CheY-like chemotaxis protein
METARKVLVVDDDQVFRGVERQILDGAGFVTEEADGGAAAISRLQEHTPDLILLDILMPDVDGWAVLQHVRGMSVRPRVVVVSGVREIVPPGDLSACITGYIFKPFRVPQLVKTCQEVLRVPAVAPIEGTRREPRRTFVADATLLGDGRVPIARGRLVQVSAAGFCMELAVAVEPGSPVTIAFRVPGREEPLEVTGCVRWRDAVMLGAEVTSLSGSDEAVLRALIDLA